MWKNRIKNLSFFLAGLFICLNIFLLIYHEDSIYKRKAYIEEWNPIIRDTVRETVSTEGVFQTAEETTVVFDPSLGTYMQTLIEENESVEKGEPLIEYQIHNFAETENSLQTQLDQVTDEIQAVETTLEQLETTPLPEEDIDFSPFSQEEETLNEEEAEKAPENLEEEEEEADTAAYLREQFRLETEKELASLQARQTRLEKELIQLSEEQSLQIQSPVSGTVKEINNQNENPSITISSPDLIVEGLLSERVRKQAELGMEVKISGIQTRGKIEDISNYPETVADGLSNYPFQVSLKEEEEAENILPGYHTAMEIILAEQENVPVVHEDHLTNTLIPAVWVMRENGTVSYQQIETGIKENRWTEIVNGAEDGQYLAKEAGNLTNGALFVTPLELRFINWSQFNNPDTALIEREPLLAGLLHR